MLEQFTNPQFFSIRFYTEKTALFAIAGNSNTNENAQSTTTADIAVNKTVWFIAALTIKFATGDQ